MQDERLFGGTMINFFLAKTHLPGLRRPWRLITVLVMALGLLLALLGPAAAADGALDPSFNPGLGVQKIPILRGQVDWTDGSGNANGNSLIFGYFTSIGGSPYNSIAKLTDTNGTVDANFNFPNLSGEVRGAMLQDPTDPNSNILIWGSFSLTSGGYTCYNIAGLKWNGSAYYVDTTFPVVFNQGGLVTSVAVMSTSYVLVGGYNMQPVGGAANTAYHLIRLDSGFHFDGTYTPRPVAARGLCDWHCS